MATRPGDQELLHPKNAGKSLLQTMWDELVSCIDQLMHQDELEIEDLDRLKGRCEGIAWCIAVLTQSPRAIDINPIKAEAMERWEATQGE